MTSELFWNAYWLHNQTFKRILYQHPITFEFSKRRFQVDNVKQLKYLPLFVVSTIGLVTILLVCFNCGLVFQEIVPLHYCLGNIMFAGIVWNIVFINVTCISKSGRFFLISANALFKEAMGNQNAKSKLHANCNSSASRPETKPSVVSLIASVRNNNGKC